MSSLKSILVILVIILIAIVAIGVGYFGINPLNHQSTSYQGMTDQQNYSQNLPGQQKQPVTDQQGIQPDSGNKAQVNSDQQSGQNPPASQNTVPNTGIVGPLIVLPAQNPEQKADPKRYINSIQEASKLIKEATGLLIGQPQSITGLPGDLPQQGTAANNGNMENIHQGLYKMGQGTTLMDIAMDGLSKEIDKTAQGGSNQNPAPTLIPQYQLPNQIPQYMGPSLSPQYYYPVPYGPYQQTSPITQYPNNALPGQQPMPQQGNSNQQSNQQSQNNSMTQHNMGLPSQNTPGLAPGNIINVPTITLVIYGILFLSIIGVFASIIGFIGNLFKPSGNQDQGRESLAK